MRSNLPDADLAPVRGSVFPSAVKVFWCALWVVWAPVSAAGASWWIDAARFHAGVHGQLSCLDCHGHLAGQKDHPDPANVNRAPLDFFPMETCRPCHEDVARDLEQGFHAGEKIGQGSGHSRCTGCHDPHYRSEHDESVPKETAPVGKMCARCHEYRSALPDPRPEDRPCMTCHRLPDPGDPEQVGKVAALCFHCHGTFPPLVDRQTYATTPHASLSCLDCHVGASAFPHGAQRLGDCRRCHTPHPDKVAHDAHLRVGCGACHIPDVRPVRDPETGSILWERARKPDRKAPIHALGTEKGEALCRRCHFSGNDLGAPAVALPPKGVLCMPCHPATFSAGDFTTLVSLFLFLLGAVNLAWMWRSGIRAKVGKGNGASAGDTSAVFRGRILCSRLWAVLKAVAFDVFLQRRLYRQSKVRWALHAVLFFPILFRLVWGLGALAASTHFAQWHVSWALVDKNHPVGALLFDVTGLMMLAGVILMAARRAARPPKCPTGLPGPDWAALGLLGGIVVLGFALEAVRIAMTGSVPGTSFAFVGRALAGLMTDLSGLDVLYGYLWYGHAVFTGALVAYIPFGRMAHMLLAPVVLTVNALCGRAPQGEGAWGAHDV